MNRTSVVMRGRGRHMAFVVMHALRVDHTRQTRACVHGAWCVRCICGGRVRGVVRRDSQTEEDRGHPNHRERRETGEGE